MAVVGALLLSPFTTRAQAAERQVLHGHVPAVVARLLPVGSLPGTNRLNLAIGLPLRNPEGLSNLLRQIYDPASPNYHHYLTPQEFTERFGSTKKDYQTVIAFAKAHGLRVTATHPDRVLLDVNGSVADIEKALHVTMRVYQHPTEKRRFHAPDTEPSLDLTTPILGISGLDDYSLPRPRLQATPLANGSKALPNAGSGPGSTYMGKDFRAAYVPDTTRDGSGQEVGLLQFDGYTASDITYYESQAGLPSITLSNVLIDGASGLPSGSGGEVEVSLDIEMAISMATNLSKVVVYMAPNPSPWEDLLSRMADDTNSLGQPNVRQLSCSWYAPGAGAKPTCDVYFQKMAAQGQSFFSASGDYDAYTGLIDFPGDRPDITQVGGTTLTTSGPGGSWVSETVWNRGNGIGSGGGISTQYPIPSWQTNISMVANGGSTTMRNTPDVALTAESVYVRADGINYTVGGTSCASPLWAGFAALVNQQAVATGKPTVGFINPLVDVIGTGANYTLAFHDITTGNNTSPSSPGRFYAVAGYDLCTGWGTPAGQKLINALANPEALIITPASGFSSIGGVGGPFTITSQSLSLTNAGTNSLNWTLVNTSLWLNAAPTGGGTLTPGGPEATVTVSLNSVASNLVVGTYSATVWFTNLNDNVGQSRQYGLSVISPPTITTQPTDQAVLEGATATFAVGATGGLPLSYQWQDNGSNLTDGGNISGSATTNLIISNVSVANVGTYTVVVTNLAGAATSSNALLTIIPSPPVIILQPANQTVVVNGTAQFTVSAIGNKPLFYQWSFGTTNIVAATNPVLTLNNVQYSQAGNYTALVTNVLGSTLSSNAVLTVIPCDPPPSGLVNWWPAEGSASDIIGGGTGTVYPGTTYGVGEVGLAFNFDGNSGCVMNTNTPPLTNIQNSFTVEFWAYPEKGFTMLPEGGGLGNSGQSYAIFPDWGGYNGQAGVGVCVGTNGISVMEHAYNYLPSVLSYTNPIIGWTHIAVVYSNKQPTLYVNGVNVRTGITSTRSFVYPSKNFGSSYDTVSGYPFQTYGPYGGLLDEISIYNRALSANEIQSIYAAGGGGKCFSGTPPLITLQPTNQTVYASSNATFGVTASGTPPLSYQWSLNGTNLSGATNTTLILTNIQPSQAGNYAVLVTNNYGSILSSNAVLTVLTLPPTITTQPTNQTVVAGQTPVFTVGARGTPLLIYQWSLNGTNISGATNTTLILTNVQPSQAGNYAVLVTNSYGSIRSSNAVLTVNPPLACDPAPSGLVGWWPGEGNAYDIIGGGNGVVYPGTTYAVGMVGQAFNFDGVSGCVMNTNTPPLTNIQNSFTMEFWAYPTKGITIPPQNNYGYPGISGQSYAIFPDWGGNNGPAGAGVSVGTNGIAVMEHAPGYLPSMLSYTNPIIGWTHIAVVYSNKQPVLYVNGINVRTGITSSQSFVYPSKNFGNEYMAGFSFQSYGPYQGLLDELSIYNRALSANEIQSIYMAGSGGKCFSGTSPLITSQPTNQTVYASGNATFGVVASGTPPLSYQWRSNTTNIVWATNTTLTLTNVQFNQAGNYAVLITNLYGSTNSANAVLSVTSSPANCDPPPPGLVDWWPGEGNAYDIIGGGNGVVYPGTTYAVGMVGQAFNFDGVSGCVMNTNTPPLTNIQNSFTMEFWAYPKKGITIPPQNNYGYPGISGQSYAIFPDWGGNGGPAGAGVSVGTNGIAVMEHAPGYLPSMLSYTNSINGWTHIAVVYSNKQPVLYVNGINVRTGITSGQSFVYPSKNFGNEYMAGFSFQSYGPYQGLLDELSIYNRALSSNEVAAIYNAGGGGKCVPQPPMIFLQPTNQTVKVGGSVNFGITAIGTMPLSYRWKFNGTNILGATNSMLTLTNVQLTDSGIYAVLVTNLYGSAMSSNAVLAVGIPPMVIIRPASQSVALGCDATFNAFARGTNPLNYQWEFNGTNLIGATNTSLTLTNVQTTDFGSYLAVVANLFGSVTSPPAQLALGHPPVAGADTIYRFATGGVRVSASVLLANDTDADGDALTILDVSSNGVAGGTVGLTNNWIYYAPPAGATNSGTFDTFTYTVSDGHCGTDVGAVTVQVRTDNPQPVTFAIADPGDGSVRLTFDGIPGYDYRLEYTADLANPNWQTLDTQAADGFGVCQFVDWSLTNAPVRFYRAVWP